MMTTGMTAHRPAARWSAWIVPGATDAMAAVITARGDPARIAMIRR